MDLDETRLYLLDIEGTICPISFVKETLYGYTLKALHRIATTKWDDPEFANVRNDFPPFAKENPEALCAHVTELQKNDVKIAYLKNLQGYVWRSGYESGEIVTPLFPDVVYRLEEMVYGGKKLAIFSSGSVGAQKLFFKYVKITEQDGSEIVKDIGSYFVGFFDTVNAGPKTEPKSYERIAEQLGFRTTQIAFVTDSKKEVSAASDAGMTAFLIDRPGNPPLEPNDHMQYRIIKDLNGIDIL
ncbi:acireductone synthase-like protein [Lineolata rhizophorae]|uniref:Acireductone synthase-like protein n=1 Tax=Lineolata rhizophorae TaxID=578093 RepID=A0A6A6NSL8_9PEZI|nr:acireductone synthase-like protein [Lineolata rhizophorae]